MGDPGIALTMPCTPYSKGAMSLSMKRRRMLTIVSALGMCLTSVAEPAAAQGSRRWSTVSDQFYLPAEHNWKFRRTYPVADRLFNAFDYGHAILYETLYAKPNASVGELEDREYDFVTRRLLVNPPRMPLEEGAIEIAYARLAPEAKMMFDWAHVLHRQAYDVWADESIALPEKDARMAELLAYYRSRPDLAFSSVPKTMDIMDGQYFSGAFREKYPRFNGLIWAYHWLQVGLYEPLVASATLDARQTGVTATVARFRQMLESPPQTMPHLMPMTAAVAPNFSRRYPEVAIIFDNLHMMHDVVSDVLVSPEVPRGSKGTEILRQAAMFRDSTSYATTVQSWWQMAQMMGDNNMGGAAGNYLASLPVPTVAYGASMAGMDHGTMPGMHGSMPGMQAQPGAQGMPGMQHGNMPGMQAQPGARGMPGMQHGNMQCCAMSMCNMSPCNMNMKLMMQMHERMMADPVIRERMATDPVLQRMMEQMQTMPQTHGTGMMNMPGMNVGAPAGASPSDEDRRQAIEFIVRLLSDPAVEARVHADPELHQLWLDPEVQRRLAELRAQAGQPAPAPSSEHRH